LRTGLRRLTTFVAVAAIPLLVPATARAACTISVTSVSFGSYDVYTSSPDDSTGTVTYRCGASNNNITVTLSSGAAGTFSLRTMKQGVSDQLSYNLYTDATRTTIWGDGTAGTSFYSASNPPKNQDVVLTVYGRIPAQQDARIGAYTDTVVATIQF
jgi:spore coat protein U-like protein